MMNNEKNFDLDQDIFFVGHSLVNHDMPRMLQTNIDHLGGEGNVSYQMILGSPLSFNWTNGGTAHNQGQNAREVIPEGNVDILVITEAVPLANALNWNDSVGNASNYYNLAIEANPNAKVYMYETWHNILSGTDRSDEVQWDDMADIPWRQRIDDDIANWEYIVDEVNNQKPEGAADMLIIPAGQALAALHDKAVAGELPGIDGAQGFFDAFFIDSIHMNDAGNAFISMVQAHTVYGADVNDLVTTHNGIWGEHLVTFSEELMEAMADVIHTTVADYERSGIDAGDIVFGDAPIATEQSIETKEDAGVSGQLSTDIDDVVFGLRNVEANENGQSVLNLSQGDLVLNADGSYIFTPSTDFFGDFEVQYTLSNLEGDSTISTIAISVAGENDAPVALDGGRRTYEDRSVDGHVRANDPDRDELTFTLKHGQPNGNGAYVLENDDGLVALLPDGSFRYWPAKDFDEEFEFDFVATDPSGLSSEARYTITVESVNDRPNTVTDYVDATSNDETITIDALANDTDPDNEILTITNARLSTSDRDLGSVSIEDNQIIFTANEGAFDHLEIGETERVVINYKISDGQYSRNGTSIVTVEGAEPINSYPDHEDNGFVSYKLADMADTGVELFGAFFQDNPDSMQIDLNAETITTWDGSIHDISGVDFLSFGNSFHGDIGGVGHMYLSEAAQTAHSEAEAAELAAQAAGHVSYQSITLTETGAQMEGAFFLDNADSMDFTLDTDGDVNSITTWDGLSHDVSDVDFISFGNRFHGDEGGIGHIYLSEEAQDMAEQTDYGYGNGLFSGNVDFIF